MTKEHEALKRIAAYPMTRTEELSVESMRALAREALAQSKQEPVAWMDGSGNVFIKYPGDDYVPPYTPLYASPQREWVRLTRDDLLVGYEDASDQPLRPQDYKIVLQFARVIDAKLKELNHD